MTQDMPAETFRRLMSRVGFASTNRLADFMGVSQSTASRWVKDGPSPPVVLMLQAMNARGWRPEDKHRIIDAEPHGEEVLRAVAAEFFESEGNHDTEAHPNDEVRWLPELSEGEAVDYLARFAQFVLAHPRAFR